MRSVASRTICLTLLLVTARASMLRAQNLSLVPPQIPEGAKTIRLRVRRADGRPFTSQPNPVLSVGIAFGTKLVMFDAKPDRPRSPQALTVILKDPGSNWSRAPREGDDLLVAVYLNKRPITAATPLPVVGGRSQSVSHQEANGVIQAAPPR
jgi:hypothetical protein